MVVMKTRHMLNANTVITGANIVLMTLAIFICFFKMSILNTSARITKGLAAMIPRKNPILAINTIANASNGKNNPIATPVLKRKSQIPFVNDTLLIAVSGRLEKSMSDA